jgi:hypothetical protein
MFPCASYVLFLIFLHFLRTFLFPFPRLRCANTAVLAPTAKSSSRPLGKRLSFPPDYFSNSRPSDLTSSSSTARGSCVRDKQDETQTRGQVRCVKQFHPLTGKLLRVFSSLKAARNAMRVPSTQDIAKCCSGMTKTSNEFVWRYSARKMTGSLSVLFTDLVIGLTCQCSYFSCSTCFNPLKCCAMACNSRGYLKERNL